jgi:trehalose 6-phosphate phosphatase
VFAGDDVTDEDALKSLGEGDLGIHVGTPPTAATVCVEDIAELAELLVALANERTRARE